MESFCQDYSRRFTFLFRTRSLSSGSHKEQLFSRNYGRSGTRPTPSHPTRLLAISRYLERVALTSAQEVLKALLGGTSATELQPEVERLPAIELTSLICAACSMREDVMANCKEVGAEVDRLLTRNCQLHATNPEACKAAAVYRCPIPQRSRAPLASTPSSRKLRP